MYSKNVVSLKNFSRSFRLASLFALSAITIAPSVLAQTPTAAPDQAVLVPFALSAKPPQGAVILIGGGGDKGTKTLQENWYRRYGTEPANWTVDKDGVVTPQKSDLTSRQEFGDCYLHAEFRTPVDKTGKPDGHGNSGIGFQGRYEVQILGDYGTAPESHGSAALYSQKASVVNASKKAGEWQTYDIIFRAPRFDQEGKVSENPRVTVFHNGVLVQNNNEFTGMTGIQYGQYKEMTKTGPLVLQGDHDVVQFRNVWVVPLPTP